MSANMDEEDIEMQSLLSSPKHHTHRAAFFTLSKNKRKLRDEALSELKFKPGIFFKTILYEGFPYPIPLILCTILENKHSAANRDFSNCPGPFFFWFWSGFLGMFFGLLGWTDEVTIYTGLTCIICTYSRAFTLAVKYAYYGNEDITGEHGILTESYTHMARLAQKLMSIFFYGNHAEMSLLAHMEEVYGTCLRLDIDLKHMEVDVGSVKIAKEIFKEIKVIRKMLSDWQKGVDKMIENKNSKKTKQKSLSTTITKNTTITNKENTTIDHDDASVSSSNKKDESSNKYVVPNNDNNTTNNDQNNNDQKQQPQKEEEEDGKMFVTLNKYAESEEKDLFYRLGIDQASDPLIESQIKRGCVPANLLAIICERRGYFFGNIWNYEFFGCFFFLSSLVNLIPAFIRMANGEAAFGTTHLSKFIMAGQFLQFTMMWWLCFYYAHSPILASYGRLRFKKAVTSLISSEGLKFVLNRKNIKVVADRNKVNTSLGMISEIDHVSQDAKKKNNMEEEEAKKEKEYLLKKQEEEEEIVEYCRIDMTNEKNIVAWNAIRHFSHHYAASMRLKLNIYEIISLVTVFSITALPTIGVTIFKTGTFPIPEHIGNIVRMVLVGGSLVLSTLVTYMVDHYDMHIRDAVTRCQQHVQSEMAHADNNDRFTVERLQNCNMLIQSSLKQIGVAHKAHPERMLMLRAEPAVCSLIVTVLGVALYFDVLRLQKTFEGYT